MGLYTEFDLDLSTFDLKDLEGHGITSSAQLGTASLFVEFDSSALTLKIAPDTVAFENQSYKIILKVQDDFEDDPKWR